ncbi:hypothetical protein AAFF_G00004580 [Aldrovandia affinis]|uniref:Uncharacterized protein n=1 Tax=Aldrovandia affinis TaxID=143900 RepID=A0AAD7TDG6_9TELE|nr:hypothetical protein AAFF_G00004580 [Aldrovandia affinis]
MAALLRHDGQDLVDAFPCVLGGHRVGPRAVVPGHDFRRLETDANRSQNQRLQVAKIRSKVLALPSHSEHTQAVAAWPEERRTGHELAGK